MYASVLKVLILLTVAKTNVIIVFLTHNVWVDKKYQLIKDFGEIVFNQINCKNALIIKIIVLEELLQICVKKDIQVPFAKHVI